MVKTIAVSEEAYKKAMAKKGAIEKKEGKVIPMADAVDELLLEREGGKRGNEKSERRNKNTFE